MVEIIKNEHSKILPYFELQITKYEKRNYGITNLFSWLLAHAEDRFQDLAAVLHR